MTWHLSRPKPALPNSYFWTWDHSCNWVWDDPGIYNYGCTNRYLKKPETFVEDYKRLTDLAAGLGIKGIVIWGFLRDSHGGIEAAKQVASYGASKGVAILPGVGTASCYEGVYYEGENQYNLGTFLKQHPGMLQKGGGFPNHDIENLDLVCPSSPDYAQWVKESIRWLFDNFEIGGVELQNGDFLCCACERCKKAAQEFPEHDQYLYIQQYLSYKPILDELAKELQEKLILCCTYTHFDFNNPSYDSYAPYMAAQPSVFDKYPADAILEWCPDLSHFPQLRKAGWPPFPIPLPMLDYLDTGVPDKVLENPYWPCSAHSPARRGTAYITNVGEINGIDCYPHKYDVMIHQVKEVCLLAYRSGLEGVSFYSEVSARHTPAALNYLAFSHFIHWPEDSLREFGRKTLGQVLGDESEGEHFMEILAYAEAGKLSDAHKEKVRNMQMGLAWEVCSGNHLERWRFWNWLWKKVEGRADKDTVCYY